MKTHKAEWQWRYSETEEPDHMNRWGRKLVVNGVMVGYVSRLHFDKLGEAKFLSHPHIPQTNNDSPFEHRVFDTKTEAIVYIEECWNKFLTKITL